MLTGALFRQLSLRLPSARALFLRPGTLQYIQKKASSRTFVKHPLGREEKEEEGKEEEDEEKKKKKKKKKKKRKKKTEKKKLAQLTAHVLETWVILCVVLREL